MYFYKIMDHNSIVFKYYITTRTLIVFLLLLLFSVSKTIAQNPKPIVYLIPGQGADSRLFKNVEIDSTLDTQYIHYLTPKKGCSMSEFAHELAKQIDTTRTFYLVGVSLGGMLATEMGEFLHPEKIILISSAKHRKELPGGYRFQKTIPFYKLISGKQSKKGALFFQPIFEPDRDFDSETFVSMLKAKDPDFIKRTIAMIIEWDKTESFNNKIVHIHGDNDHTIPVRNVDYDYLIKDGSHMMVLTRGKEISTLLNKILIEL